MRRIVVKAGVLVKLMLKQNYYKAGVWDGAATAFADRGRPRLGRWRFSTSRRSRFEQLEKYIDLHGDRDLDELLEEIREKLDPAIRKHQDINRYVERLKSAGHDEAKFHAALQLIKNDKAIDKDDVLQIARTYGVIRISGKSKPSYIESLDKHFCWRLYNRDADEMAKRATPW